MSYVNPFPHVPSASKMYRISNCPASFKMELHVNDYSNTRDADKGNQIHGILAGEVNENNSPFDAVQTAEMCEDQCERLLADWKCDDDTPIAVLREQRYALTDRGYVVTARPDLLANVIFTGQFDRLYIQGNRGLLIDFKGLHGKHPHALENPQLASLTVLVKTKHAILGLRVAIVQPWKGKPTTADYHTHSFLDARDWLDRTLEKERTATPDDRNVGEWCHNCAARFGCDKFQGRAIQQVEVIEPATIAGLDAETQRKAMWSRALDLPAARLAAAMNGLAMVKRYVATIEGVAKARAENDPEFQQFFTLREKKGKRSISDVGKVFAACETHGVTAEQFTAMCSIGLGDVKQLLKDATHAKGKALDNLHDAVLTGAIETGKGSTELIPAGQLE